MYSYYTSNITHSDSVTTTLGVVHQFSPQLTISASGGGFWSDIEATQGDAATGDRRRATGGLYGGSISYAFSERTQLNVSLAENLTPSGTGTLSKSDSAGASLSHQFSDRFNGRLGASYTRTIFPTTSSSYNNNYYQGEVGVSYQLAERWTLDAGYRYSRAHYSQNSFEPKSNVGFVSIGYNWPGTSFTDWVGHAPTRRVCRGPAPCRSPRVRRARAAAGHAAGRRRQKARRSIGSPSHRFGPRSALAVTYCSHQFAIGEFVRTIRAHRGGCCKITTMEDESSRSIDYDGDKTPGEYLSALRRRKGQILAVTALVAAIAVVIAIALPAVYRSTATILVQEQEMPPDLVRSTITSFADERIQVISQQVMTRAVLLGLVDKYGLYEKYRSARPTTRSSSGCARTSSSRPSTPTSRTGAAGAA